MARRLNHGSKWLGRSQCSAAAVSGFGLLSTHKEYVMSTFTTAIRTFIQDEDGVTALEYGMIAALIAAVIVATVTTLGEQVKAGFKAVSDALPDLPAAT
jgi:pilus assembly protein Flp/PilA